VHSSKRWTSEAHLVNTAEAKANYRGHCQSQRKLRYQKEYEAPRFKGHKCARRPEKRTVVFMRAIKLLEF